MAVSLLHRLKSYPFWFVLLGAVNAALLVAVLTAAFILEESFIGLPLVALVFGVACLCLGGWAALFLTSFLASIFYLFSLAKYLTSGFGLVISDSTMIGGNIIDLLRLDWRVQLFTLGLFIVLVLQGLFLARMARTNKRHLAVGAIALLCAAVAVPIVRSATQEAMERSKPPRWAVGTVPSLATFTGSLALPALTMPTSERLPWSDDLLASVEPSQDKDEPAPRLNLFLLLYESTFDPAYLDEASLPVRPSELLRPSSGVAGPLLVPAYSGGTWLTEFALMTGQSPHAFGANAYALNSLLEGRIATTLIDPILSADARFKVIYPFPAYFLNAGAFYRGLGADFIEPDAGELTSFRQDFSDDFLFKKALAHLEREHSNIQLIVTMKNHGPHNLNAPFEDYWERHSLQESALQSFKAELAQLFPDQANYLLAFGDHQPFFTHNQIDSDKLRHTTFWSLDCVGRCAPLKAERFRDQPIGIEFLLTEIMDGLGLPISRTSLVHRRLFREGCYSFLFECGKDVAQSFNWYFGQAVICGKPSS